MKIAIPLILLVLSPFEITTKVNNFRDILQTKSSTYVDKTLLLKDVLQPVFRGGTLLITMPKRFGKSTNLQMIKTFCEIEMLNDATPVTKNPNNVNDTPNYLMFTKKYTFGHLKIAYEKEFVRENLGKHPVAYFDFQPCSRGVKNLNQGVSCCGIAIQNAFDLHKYLLNSTRLEDNEKNIIRKWTSDEHKEYRQDKYNVEYGIYNLLGILFKHFDQKKVIVLVDEIDAFVNNVIIEKCSDEELKSILQFFASIFLLSLKYESHYRVAVLTGIVPISQDGMSNGLPRFDQFLFARNQEFVQHYGFSLEEVRELFQRPENNFENVNFEKMKEYYGGYNVSGRNIYTPYSIIQCLQTKTIEPFWANVGSIDYIWPALRIMKIRNMVIDLCNKTSLNFEIMENFRIDNIIDLRNCIQMNGAIRNRVPNKIEVLFSFLLYSGYFRINSVNEPYFNVSVANEETRSDLKQLLETYKKETILDEEFKISLRIVKSLTELGYDNFESNIQSITDDINQLGKLALLVEDHEVADLNDLVRSICFYANLNYRVEQADQIIIPTPLPRQVTASPEHSNTIIPVCKKLRTTKTKIRKKEESRDTKNLVIIEMKYGHYGTSKTALEQIKTQYDGGVLASKYNNQTAPYNLLMLGIHLAPRMSLPYINVSAQITNVTNAGDFSKSKIIHCEPTEIVYFLEDNSRPTKLKKHHKPRSAIF